MTKKRAKVNFIIVAILLIVGLVLSFVKMPMAFSSDNYASLFGALTKTGDLSDGIVAVYDITTDDISDEDVDNTIKTLSNIIIRQGFRESRVFRQDNSIRVETENIEGADDILKEIGTPITIEIDNKSGEEKSEYYLTEKDIVDASLYTTTEDYTKTVYGITIQFTSAGQEKFYNLTNEAYTADSSNAKIYMSINGDEQNGISISEAMDTNVISYSLYSTEDSSKFSIYEAKAKEYVVQFQVATADVKIETRQIFKATSLEQSGYTYAMIIFAVAIVLSLALFIVKYRDLGLMMGLSSLLFIVFSLFFMQAIPGVYVSVAGIYGLILSFCLMQALQYLLAKNIKTEFAYVKRLPLAFRSGYKKSVFEILDICVITFVFAIIMVFVGGATIMSFGSLLAIGSAIALFTNIVVTKGFLDWYTSINSTKPNRLNFKKENKENA